MGERPVVAVVGAGASGVLTATHVARAAQAAGRSVDVLLVDPAPLAQGLAYSTPDPRHRLNVPAKGMSALPEDGEHFLRWLYRHVHPEFPAGGFAPRLHYADYLRQTLEDVSGPGTGVHVEHLADTVRDLRRHGRRLRLTLADGTSRPADAVVLAMGHGAPSTTWAPEQLAASPHFLADPWRASSAPTVRAGDHVLLVGAGLTMADMAQRWGRRGVTLHVASRHGMLPLPHAQDPRPPLPAELDRTLEPDPSGAASLSLADARRLVFRHVRRAGGDWRRAIDGLRPVTSALWSRMDDRARRDFLRTAARRWDRVRHRVDPALSAWLQQRVDDGSLVVHAAEVRDAVDDGDRVVVELSDGTRQRFAAVLNCTGTCVGLRASDDPLVLNLLTSGTARPGSLDLGFATDDGGRVLSGDGSSPAVWTVGPLRRGELWESTAVPEIRAQAAEVARDVVAALPSPTLQRRVRDPFGLPLTAATDAAMLYNDALGNILRVRSGAEGLLRDALVADPQFALGQAALALLGVEWGADVDVDAALAHAQRHAGRADEREQRFVEVAAQRVREPGAGSAAALLAYIQTYPEDALAVSIAVPTIAFGGATEIPAEAWALVEGLAPVYGEHWWYRSLLAFVRQEQERYDEARELADLSLGVEPAAGHAVHARTHVHYETGDHLAGLRWLDGWIRTCGARASHRAHFSWHAALHELALGDDRAVLSRYATQLAPPVVTGVRALVDSASLLWRGFVAGAWDTVDVGPVLATVDPALLAAPPTPFVGLHAALALTAAGDAPALARLRRYAAARPEPVFRETVAPLADGLVHLVLGDADRAADALGALHGVEQLGGSAAQREIVQDTLVLAAVRCGRGQLARSILHARLDRRPSPRDVQRSLGLPSGPR
ncbi:FAD/NAD(P)-binding protein [uncultured Jatrophihabitans sp.]|uniref:FAD/NAD(P)-binding protein n=1 Tax=uncultured Jatrophihabitans sp. TaxID=1610747 RepID=UPI0035C971EF